MAQTDDSNAQVILTIGAVSGFTVIVLAIGLQAWFLSEEQAELQVKQEQSVNMELVEARVAQEAKINTYRWIDQQRRVAAIPIDQAMKLLIENQGKVPTTNPS